MVVSALRERMEPIRMLAVATEHKQLGIHKMLPVIRFELEGLPRSHERCSWRAQFERAKAS